MAEQRQDLAAAKRERYAVNDGLRAVAGGDLGKLQERAQIAPPK
jgi:hypothetical protein